MRPVGPAARNEARKLLATSLNTVGLSVFGLGVLSPVLSGTTVGWVQIALGCAILMLFHAAAQAVIRRLEG